MSKLLEEIKYAFSNIDEGKAWPVDRIEEASKGWLIRGKGGSMIAALPSSYDGVFDEQFAGIHMRTSTRLINGSYEKLIIIECDKYDNREPFARLCEDFLSEKMGPQTAQNPKLWWKRWKELMGNMSSKKRPYAVIGELFLILELLRKRQRPDWTGPSGGTHDIELERFSFEVKSTTERVGETITISSQHQLSVNKEKILNLIFFRFEESKSNLSINSLVKNLVDEGFSDDTLEERLRKLGYPEGRTARDSQYRLLEANVYTVNDEFPKIIPSTFKGGILPQGIVKLTYDINLSNLKRKQLDEFMESLPSN